MSYSTASSTTKSIGKLEIFLPIILLGRRRIALRQFLVRAIKRRYRLSAFGLLWTVIVPLATLGIYTFVFGFVLESRWDTSGDAGTYGFGFYLFSGLIVFWALAEVMGQAPVAIVEHSNLVKRAVFPLEILPPVAVGNAIFHTFVNAGVLIVALAIIERHVPATALLLPIVLAPFVLLLIGFAWILAAVGVYFRDIVHIVGLVMTGALFISPVFYSIDRLSPTLQAFIFVNPITFIINQVRLVVLDGTNPDWLGLGIYLLVAWITASLGLVFFRYARANFADVL